MQSYGIDAPAEPLMQGKRNRKHGTLTELAVYRNRPTEQFGEFFYNVKPKTNAAIFACGRAIDLLEHVKNGLNLISGNSDPGVGDFELDAAGFRGTPSRNRHAPSLGKLDRIVNQILQHAFEFLVVGLDSWQIGGVVPK
jgi:hypothetical protein